MALPRTLPPNQSHNLPLPTLPPGPILVAVDPKRPMRHLLLAAERYARALDAQIIVYHQHVDPIVTVPTGSITRQPHRVNDAITDFKRTLFRESRALRTPCSVHVDVMPTSAFAERLSALANAKGASMVLIASRDRSSLDRLLFGSRVSDTIQQSNVPVLIVPEPDRADSPSPRINQTSQGGPS